MPSESVLHSIRQALDYEAVFSEVLRLEGRGPERRAKCVFHEDTNPSMSVNVVDGVFYCHGCQARGDIFTFWQRVRSVSFPDAAAELARRAGVVLDAPPLAPDPTALAEAQQRLLQQYVPAVAAPPPTIDEAIVLAYHERLHATEPALAILQERRGLTPETVTRFQLGYDGQRYFIPIRDEDGECVNIRRYKMGPGVRPENKMMSWRQGFGMARLFPLATLANAPAGSRVYLVEGEMDCLLAQQLGLPAVTTTGGAGTWKEAWNPWFAGRDVVICYDRDDAGRIGAAAVARQLHPVARSVRVVTIPLAEPVGADFTDYVHGHGHSASDFEALVEQTPLWVPDHVSHEPPPDVEPADLHLSEASQAQYFNQPIRVGVMVSGKTVAPYLVPDNLRVHCSMPGLNMCNRCPVSANNGLLQSQLDFDNNELLQFINVPDRQLRTLMKEKVGIPPKCRFVEWDVQHALNLEEITVIPSIDQTSQEAAYVTRQAYFVGHGLVTNREYVVTGVTVPDPKRQLATHVLHAAVPSQSNIDAFRLTADVWEGLRIFQPQRPGLEGLWEQAARIHADLEHYTRIYERRDLMLAVDLVLHSPLQFEFQGERLARGWAEALVIGDSRTGKTMTVKRMFEWYRAGEFTTGENTTLAGLLGGLHQVGTAWVLQWGRIPLNDRRALAIDEAGNLPKDQIARLSSLRSSGIAEVVKVHTERTHARTRQIWISNPRSPRPLSSFSQGVKAVKELIGAPEDIARFDLVVTAASADVALSTINASRGVETPQVFTQSLCHQRIMWAWSRQIAGDARVRWAPGAEQLVLDRATEQGRRYAYATEIPLVEPNEQRVKIARLAVAAATMFCSATEDGDAIMVLPEHVEFVAQFLDQLYHKPTLAFAEYADMQRRSNELQLEESVTTIVHRRVTATRQFMDQEELSQQDLREILGYDEAKALREAISTLRSAGFLQRRGSGYVKTPAAIEWLRRALRNGAGRIPAVADIPVNVDALPDEPRF
jgi:hypothetical protein